MSPPVTEPTSGLSDRAISWIRTAIPTVWGALVAQLLLWLSPRLPADIVDALAEWLTGPVAIGLLTAAAIAAWYVVWRWLEPRIPPWLARLVLGSSQAPAYGLTVATYSAGELVSLRSLANALDEGDEARVALERILPGA